MILDPYDRIEKGEGVLQSLFRLQQSAPPQVMEIPSKTEDNSIKDKSSKKKNKYKNSSSDLSYASSSDESSFRSSQSGSSDDDDENEAAGQKIQFILASLTKVVPKKKGELRMVAEDNTEMRLYAKYDNKATKWLIYKNEPGENEFKADSPDFEFKKRTNDETWVLMSNHCERCIGKKKCQPYTHKRQWLMFVTHEVEKETDCAVHILQILLPKTDEKLKQTVICPKSMDQQHVQYNYNDPDFSYYEIDSKKKNTLPDKCFYIRTKFPTWSENLNAWVIDSYGRIKLASKRNFQLLFDALNFNEDHKTHQYQDKDYFPIYQMGKVSSGNYVVDYRHPLSFVQSFAIALCTHTWKSKL